MVSESAFWIPDFLIFLEVPEDLRPTLSTQRLVRLSELQHHSKCSPAPVASPQPEPDVGAAVCGSSSPAIPFLPSLATQVRLSSDSQRYAQQCQPFNILLHFRSSLVSLLGFRAQEKSSGFHRSPRTTMPPKVRRPNARKATHAERLSRVASNEDTP